MRTAWMVIGDSSRLRIFAGSDSQDKVRELEDFVNPKGRAENRELITDAYGRRTGGKEGGQGHVSIPSPKEPVIHETELFVVKELVKAISWFDGRDIEDYLRRLKV